jgi:predicted transcriptional regulator
MGFIGDDEEAPAQRRSKTEMVCDLMLAISKGAVRPTRIMQRANLTWNALLVYLNLLAMNGLVRREERDGVSTYHLTERGKETLQAYLTLKERLLPLKLETTDLKSLAKHTRPVLVPQVEGVDVGPLREELEASGYKMLPNVIAGKSGVKHQFGVVAKGKDGKVHGYVLAARPDEKLVLGLFITQLDTGATVHIAHTGDPEPSAVERAREYGIELDLIGPRRGDDKSKKRSY